MLGTRTCVVFLDFEGTSSFLGMEQWERGKQEWRQITDWVVLILPAYCSHKQRLRSGFGVTIPVPSVSRAPIVFASPDEAAPAPGG